tara:strand:+ start:3347 stop:3616 length:270 start_codon:yes stop_codon:yes gene_type:complete
MIINIIERIIVIFYNIFETVLVQIKHEINIWTEAVDLSVLFFNEKLNFDRTEFMIYAIIKIIKIVIKTENKVITIVQKKIRLYVTRVNW